MVQSKEKKVPKLLISEVSSAEFPWDEFKTNSKLRPEDINEHIKLLKYVQDTKEKKTVAFEYLDTHGVANASLKHVVPEFETIYKSVDYNAVLIQFLNQKK
jgi:hypothetical protein